MFRELCKIRQNCFSILLNFPSIILKIDVRKFLNPPITYKKTKFFSFFSFVSNIKMLSSVVHEDMKAVRTLEKYKTRVKWLLKVVKQLLLLHNLYKSTKEGILLCIIVYRNHISQRIYWILDVWRHSMLQCSKSSYDLRDSSGIVNLKGMKTDTVLGCTH